MKMPCQNCRPQLKCATCKKKAAATARRRELHNAYASLGIKRVRGAQGGIYWE